MYKSIVLVIAFLLPLLLAAATLNVEVNFERPASGLKLQDLAQQGYGFVSAAGAYQLPVRNVQILLPPASVLTSWTLSLSSATEIPGPAPQRNAGFYDGERLLSSSPQETLSNYVYLGMKHWGELQYAAFQVLPASWDGNRWLWHSSARIELNYDQPKQIRA